MDVVVVCVVCVTVEFIYGSLIDTFTPMPPTFTPALIQPVAVVVVVSVMVPETGAGCPE